jgi:hypothetical protein
MGVSAVAKGRGKVRLTVLISKVEATYVRKLVYFEKSKYYTVELYVKPSQVCSPRIVMNAMNVLVLVDNETIQRADAVQYMKVLSARCHHLIM